MWRNIYSRVMLRHACLHATQISHPPYCTDQKKYLHTRTRNICINIDIVAYNIGKLLLNFFRLNLIFVVPGNLSAWISDQTSVQILDRSNNLWIPLVTNYFVLFFINTVILTDVHAQNCKTTYVCTLRPKLISLPLSPNLIRSIRKVQVAFGKLEAVHSRLEKRASNSLKSIHELVQHQLACTLIRTVHKEMVVVVNQPAIFRIGCSI